MIYIVATDLLRPASTQEADRKSAVVHVPIYATALPPPLLPTPKNRPPRPIPPMIAKIRLRVTAPATPTDVAVALTAVVAMRRFRRSKKKPLKTGFEKLCRFAAGAKGRSPGPHILVDGGRSPLHSDRPLIPAPAAPAALQTHCQPSVSAARTSAYSAPRPSSPALSRASM